MGSDCGEFSTDRNFMIFWEGVAADSFDNTAFTYAWVAYQYELESSIKLAVWRRQDKTGGVLKYVTGII